MPTQQTELAEDYLELASSLPRRDPEVEEYLRSAVKLLQGSRPESLAIAQYRLGAQLTDYYDRSHYAEAKELFSSSCHQLNDEADSLDHSACQADYAELLRYEGDCFSANVALDGLVGKDKRDAIATTPDARRIAEKAGIILQECDKQYP